MAALACPFHQTTSIEEHQGRVISLWHILPLPSIFQTLTLCKDCVYIQIAFAEGYQAQGLRESEDELC
jgi:hypothetical protein